MVTEHRLHLLGKFACRFCRHDQYEHNNIQGCPHCRCMATVGEAGARSDAEDLPILPPSETLPGYTRRDDSDRDMAPPDPSDLSRYTEAAAQMADPARYAELRALTFDQRHECPVTDCRLSAEEHHRLAFGMISENRALKRRVEELEHGREVDES